MGGEPQAFMLWEQQMMASPSQRRLSPGWRSASAKRSSPDHGFRALQLRFFQGPPLPPPVPGKSSDACTPSVTPPRDAADADDVGDAKSLPNSKQPLAHDERRTTPLQPAPMGAQAPP